MTTQTDILERLKARLGVETDEELLSAVDEMAKALEDIDEEVQNELEQSVEGAEEGEEGEAEALEALGDLVDEDEEDEEDDEDEADEFYDDEGYEEGDYEDEALFQEYEHGRDSVGRALTIGALGAGIGLGLGAYGALKGIPYARRLYRRLMSVYLPAVRSGVSKLPKLARRRLRRLSRVANRRLSKLVGQAKVRLPVLRRQTRRLLRKVAKQAKARTGGLRSRLGALVTALRRRFPRIRVSRGVARATTTRRQGPRTIRMSEGDDRIVALENRLLMREILDTGAHYLQEVLPLRGVPGTPDELAEILTHLHYWGGPGVAEMTLDAWKRANKDAIQSNAFGVSLSSVRQMEQEDPFMAEVRKFQEQRKVSEAEAIKLVMKERPDLWAEHTRLVRGR